MREVVAEDGLEAKPVEEAVEDRQGTDGVGVEGPACGAGGSAGLEWWRGSACWGVRVGDAREFPRCGLALMVVAGQRLASPPAMIAVTGRRSRGENSKKDL